MSQDIPSPTRTTPTNPKLTMMRKLLLRSYTFDANTPNGIPPRRDTGPSDHSRSSSRPIDASQWSRSTSQPAPGKDHEFQETSDGNWTYCINSDTTSAITGFGNVPIVTYEQISKMKDRKLRVCSITWNINEKNAKTINHLAKKITERHEEMDSDIVFISLQEIPSTATTFHEEALSILEPVFRSHSLYLSHRAWAQMVIVFMRHQHVKYAITPQVAFVPSGNLAKPVRTKGAIAVCLRIYQRWIVLIGCHLTHAHLKERINDYAKIVKQLKFAPLRKFHPHGNDDCFSADVILWTGDLNFRVTIENDVDWKTAATLDEKVYDKILENEELMMTRGKADAFADFMEQPIRFAPTHKFEPDSDEYVIKRIPSYTDRLLYWTKKSDWVHPIKYDSLKGPCPSDHKPVFATLWITVINKPIPEKFNSADSKSSLITATLNGSAE